MSNGISIRGKLEYLKDVPMKLYDGKRTDPYQLLQVSYVDENGFQLVSIKDNNYLTDSKLVGRDIDCAVSFTSYNNNTYFKLLFVQLVTEK